jgi:hypothetical protein
MLQTIHAEIFFEGQTMFGQSELKLEGAANKS